MSKAKKSSYIVTRPGVMLGLGDKAVDHEVGDEVKLTEAQATGLIGKVKTKAEYAGESQTVESLKKALKKSEKENEVLKDQLGKLTEQLTGAGNESEPGVDDKDDDGAAE